MKAPACLSFLFVLGDLATAQASASPTFADIEPSDELDWQPCYQGFSCARLNVGLPVQHLLCLSVVVTAANSLTPSIKAPLDYNEPSLGNAIIPLVKLPSQTNNTDESHRGLLLFNPGGFGLSGVNFTLQSGSAIQAMVGPNWDIVSFDPRGIGFSAPAVDCGSPENDEAKSSRSVPRIADRFYENRISEAKEAGEACKAAIGGENDVGPHMSTATVARDLLHIVDAYSNTDQGNKAPDQGKLLNFLGLSYSTYLGQTFASMFPERVGYMVLDAVLNPVSIQDSFSEDVLTHVDGIIAGFFVYCHAAGPDKCVYYTGDSPTDIWKRFAESFRQLDTTAALVRRGLEPEAAYQDALFTLKVALFNLSYTPNVSFEQLAEILLALEKALSSQNIETWTEDTAELVMDSAGASSLNIYTMAMLCPEQGNRWYDEPLQAFQPMIEANKKESIIGDLAANIGVLSCTGWSINSTEIYDGEFGAEATKTPILFVSNSYDPVCPKENSYLAVSRFPNSQALLVDSLGHSSLAPANTCAFSKIQNYFQTGEMPSKDESCPLETGPFGVLLEGTMSDNIHSAGLTDLLSLL